MQVKIDLWESTGSQNEKNLIEEQKSEESFPESSNNGDGSDL